MNQRESRDKMAKLRKYGILAIPVLAIAASGCGKATPPPPIDRFDPAAIGAKVPQDVVPTDPAKLDTRYLDKDGLVRRRLTRPEVVALLSAGVQIDFVQTIPNGWNGIQYFSRDGRWRGTRPMSGGDFVGRYVIRKDGAYCWIEPDHESMTNCYVFEQDSLQRIYAINTRPNGLLVFTIYEISIKSWRAKS